MTERLQKVLAHCGVASRRECETIIEQGRVEVNGRVVTKVGTKIEPGKDEVRVDGERVKIEDRVYYLLNKPKGYICTSSDERGRRTTPPGPAATGGHHRADADLAHRRHLGR